MQIILNHFEIFYSKSYPFQKNQDSPKIFQLKYCITDDEYFSHRKRQDMKWLYKPQNHVDVLNLKCFGPCLPRIRPLHKIRNMMEPCFRHTSVRCYCYKFTVEIVVGKHLFGVNGWESHILWLRFHPRRPVPNCCVCLFMFERDFFNFFPLVHIPTSIRYGSETNIQPCWIQKFRVSERWHHESTDSIRASDEMESKA